MNKTALVIAAVLLVLAGAWFVMSRRKGRSVAGPAALGAVGALIAAVALGQKAPEPEADAPPLPTEENLKVAAQPPAPSNSATLWIEADGMDMALELAWNGEDVVHEIESFDDLRAKILQYDLGSVMVNYPSIADRVKVDAILDVLKSAGVRHIHKNRRQVQPSEQPMGVVSPLMAAGPNVVSADARALFDQLSRQNKG